MTKSHFSLAAAIVAPIATLMAGCASAPPSPPDVPAALRSPAGETLFLEALASGVQIYECDAATATWVFKLPEATLADRSGRSLGKHYGGPTWESLDGSKAIGDVKARDPGPDKQAIPWLLLNAKATTGNGVFTPTKSIQRVQTVAGVAPSKPCAETNAKQVERVPYTATYYFYR